MRERRRSGINRRMKSGEPDRANACDERGPGFNTLMGYDPTTQTTIVTWDFVVETETA